jgi:acylphosphatase
MTGNMVAKRITFAGTVQGVFFRDFVKTNADELRVKGYVKNMEDGTVEAVFEGEEGKIDKLIEKCKKEPRVARVDKVRIEEAPIKSHKSFKIDY